jgi:hypothetical protein
MRFRRFGLPAKAKFCPRCRKRHAIVEAASGSALEGVSLQNEEARPTSERGTDADGDASVTSNKAGAPHRFVWEVLEPESPPPPPALLKSSGTEGPKPNLRYANAGSITLGALAITCLVLSAIQGFIPILLIESVALGGLAWLCAARWPLTTLLHSIVLVSSLLIAVLVGVTLDQDSFGPRYRYLSQGSVQYRVDEKAGRTDRLGNSGWYPVAYDREAQKVPDSDNIFSPAIVLINGQWTSVLGGQICFSAANSSDYFVDRNSIKVQAQKQNGPVTLDQQVTLKSYGGGFIGIGQNSMVCASSPRDLSADETWSYTYVDAYGCKR